MQDLDIIFEDGDVLVINKPAGVGTQAPIAFDSLEARIRTYLNEVQSDLDRAPYLGIPHRLDRCVSGAMVFAKRRKPAQRLSKQFERREVEKKYLALVAGNVEPNHGEWKDHLRKIPEEPRGELISSERLPDFPDAKLAIMQYEATAVQADRTQLRVRLETGRMHQIRIQCSARGYPVVGDTMYGSELQYGPKPENERDRQIALHAVEIQFEHPRVREQMRFTAPLPKAWPE